MSVIENSTNISNLKNNPNIAIILPAFNESITIQTTIQSFFKYLPKALFVVINNNSTDKTKQIAKETLKKLKVRFLLLDESQKGKANALRQAFHRVKAEVYLVCDADMTYPANQSYKLIEPILKGKADMVVGDRISGGSYKNQNKRKFHSLGNIFICWLVNKLFKGNLCDILSGYRALSYRFVKNYSILVKGFEIEADITAHAMDKRISILEVPIKYKNRPENSQSKLNTFKDGFRILFVLIQIFRYYRPFLFFNILFFFFGCTGLIVAVPVFQDWILLYNALKILHKFPLNSLLTNQQIKILPRL